MILLLLLSAMAQASDCVPAREFVPIPGTPGMYQRTSPDGNYVLQSFSGAELGDVALFDFSERDPATGQRKLRILKTPLRNETFPVENHWRYFASPGGLFSGMEYYRFSDVVKEQQKAKPFFTDPFGEFYHTIGEFPDSTNSTPHFRVMTWTQLFYKDYLIHVNPDGSFGGKEKPASGMLCNNIAGSEGFELVQPMLSKDGAEVAGIPQGARTPTMRVYRILNAKGDCEKVLDLGYQTSKVCFSHPRAGSQGMLTYTTADGVFVYDRDRAIAIPINDRNHETGGSYPGFSKDGRVVYLTQRDGQFGYAIVDPYQVYPNAAKACITAEERDAAAAEFRAAVKDF